ncbi:MAG: hypothetical protein L0H41_00320 [Microlunatus sp.]|nr:hypothetical protein [Microlunatus sp.]MDN5804913.1 hypothetical protein [Microlunatus sp.]
MTAHTIAAHNQSLDPELADLITDAVVWSSDAGERADVLTEIVACVVDAVLWRLQPDGDPVEERGVHQVLEAALEYQRSRRLCASGGADGCGASR